MSETNKKSSINNSLRQIMDKMGYPKLVSYCKFNTKRQNQTLMQNLDTKQHRSIYETCL